jgi:hypothetical protein
MIGMKTLSAGIVVLILASLGIATTVGYDRAIAVQFPEKAYAKNFEKIAYHDLGGRAGFKMAMQVVGGRWYLYLAGLWRGGWMILDVTDPSKPQLLKVIAAPESTQAVQIQVSQGLMLTGLEKPSTELLAGAPWHTFAWLVGHTLKGNLLLKPWIRPGDGVLVWDAKDPISPIPLGQWKSNASGTHRNFYNGGRYAYLTATQPGYRGHFLVIVDLKDPKFPREASRWSLPEQNLKSTEKPTREGYYLHGPAHVENGRAYLPYGIGGAIILDVSDPTQPREIGRLKMPENLGSSQGVHTFLPLKSRGLAVISSEAHEERCRADPGETYAAMVDILDEKNPKVMSLFPSPKPPEDAPYKSYCDRPGRAGPHNQHHNNGEAHLFASDHLTYIASFSAGLRLYDTSDPKQVQEIGYFVPPDPTRRLGPLPTGLVTQTEDVLVDARGYAYITDKNQGLYVVKATAPQALVELAKQTKFALPPSSSPTVR